MWHLANKTFESRFIMGTANYPSLEILCAAIKAAQIEVITVSLKRENANERSSISFWEAIGALGCSVLPNTAGCYTAKEAVYVAQLAQEVFATNWIKLEVIGDEALLQPDGFELIKATEQLIALGFCVFPFCTDDVLLCQRLYQTGCDILMPWGAPIGTGKGLLNTYHLSHIRERLPDATLIIDAGIGSPIHAMQAMLLGYDGVLVNSAIANALKPVEMAKAFQLGVQSGRLAYEAGVMPEQALAVPSTAPCLTLGGAN